MNLSEYFVLIALFIIYLCNIYFPMLTSEEYIKQRLDDQINWYDAKSQFNQKRYKRLRITSTLLAVSIPVLTAVLNEGNQEYVKIIIGVVGAGIALLEGVQQLYKYNEHWLEYRTTSENLKHQKYLFITQCDPYIGENAFKNFVITAEAIMANENSKWSQFINSNKKSEGDSAEQEKRG